MHKGLKGKCRTYLPFSKFMLASAKGQPRAHFIQITATMPIATITETMNIARFCQKSKLPAWNASQSRMKASQLKPTATVPATRDPKLMVLELQRHGYYCFRSPKVCAFDLWNIKVSLFQFMSSRLRFNHADMFQPRESMLSGTGHLLSE